MERIVIEVEDEIAKKWKYSSKHAKDILAKSFAQNIKNSFSEKDDFWKFALKGRELAESKGFNEKILKEILSDE